MTTFPFLENTKVAEDDLITTYNELKTNSLANYVVIYNNSCSPVYGGCHSRLNRLSTGVLYVLNKLPKGNKKSLLFYKWLAQDSPWSGACVVKDMDFVEKWGIVSDAKAPVGVFQGLNILSRAYKECPSRIDLWYKLVTEKMVDPLTAFLFISTFTPSSDAYMIFPWVGHNAVCVRSLSSCQIQRMRNKDYNAKPIETYFDTGKYSNVLNCFSTKAGIPIVYSNQNLVSFFKSRFSKTVLFNKITTVNPFGVDVSVFEGGTRDQFLSTDLDKLIEVFEEYLETLEEEGK